MPNMSYCRFENTLNDLCDCEDTLQAMCDCDEEALSQSELFAAQELVACAMRIVRMMAEEGQLDLANSDHPQFDDTLSEVVALLNKEL